MLATDLLSLFGKATMRTDKRLEPFTLAVRIGYEEQHARGMPGDNGRNLLENVPLFLGITTEDHQLGHAGPRHQWTYLTRLRIRPEAGEPGLDSGQIDLLRVMRGKGRGA